MAKSARASRTKTNKLKLAAAIFRPVEDARIARLSEKVLAIANSSKGPNCVPGEMDVDTKGKGPKKLKKSEGKESAMEVDGEKTIEQLKGERTGASRVNRRGRQSRHVVVSQEPRRVQQPRDGLVKVPVGGLRGSL